MHLKHLEVILKKILEPDILDAELARWRLKDEKIVFTNGCFDILHRGHIEYLAAAADLGTKLIIGINSDESVRKLKGEGRPVNSFPDRALALAALHFSSAIVFFNEQTPELLIKKVCPHVLVKGGDYRADEVVGGDFVRDNGGVVSIIPLSDGYSTTLFLNKISRANEH